MTTTVKIPKLESALGIFFTDNPPAMGAYIEVETKNGSRIYGRVSMVEQVHHTNTFKVMLRLGEVSL